MQCRLAQPQQFKLNNYFIEQGIYPSCVVLCCTDLEQKGQITVLTQMQKILITGTAVKFPWVVQGRWGNTPKAIFPAQGMQCRLANLSSVS